MSIPLLIASVLAGILVTCVGIYRAYKQGEFMPLVLGMLILMSCAANYLKRQGQLGGKQDESKSKTPENQDERIN
jgi:hypothetical protein